jgi:exopolyphosphatase/guanosine-5'-triphosphate,3'-diphosphate pyrophosphatase
MEEIGIERMRVADRGLREGLIVDYLARNHPTLVQGLPVRDRSVLQLMRACGADEKHADIVRHLALRLFDDARKLGLHKLDQNARELLGHAAMLHDVGAFLSYNNHEQHSYYLIRNAELVGFDDVEIGVIAAVARFHRRGKPGKRHPEYAELGKRQRRLIRPLVTFLRLAESLDRSHGGLVMDARLTADGADRVVLVVQCANECELEIWGAEAQARLMEKSFGCKLEVRFAAAELPPPASAAPVPPARSMEGTG